MTIPIGTPQSKMMDPTFVEIGELCRDRPHPAATAARFRGGGIWRAGSLEALARPVIAIVGSRAPSDAGRRLAQRLARELAEHGVCIVSGLALGIDGAAHAGAVEARTPTIGILGGGHRHFFPQRNLALAERMLAAGGAVLSPYAPDAHARPYQFLQRNAIVAALADAVLVVEAAARSGALNTASWASDYSVPVLAVPGDVDRAKAAGCNALIRDGATLVRSANDVLSAIGKKDAAESEPHASPQAATLLKTLPYANEILRELAAEPRDVETLATRLDAAIGVVLGTLVRLELLGAIARDGTRYCLTP